MRESRGSWPRGCLRERNEAFVTRMHTRDRCQQIGVNVPRGKCHRMHSCYPIVQFYSYYFCFFFSFIQSDRVRRNERPDCELLRVTFDFPLTKSQKIFLESITGADKVIFQVFRNSKCIANMHVCRNDLVQVNTDYVRYLTYLLSSSQYWYTKTVNRKFLDFASTITYVGSYSTSFMSQYHSWITDNVIIQISILLLLLYFSYSWFHFLFHRVLSK